jgi:hypothetical protein
VLPQSRLRSIERQGLDMDLGLQMWDKGLSLEDASKKEMSTIDFKTKICGGVGRKSIGQ